MYHNMLRVMLTVVMLLFILMGAHAVVSLGFGWWGVGIPILMAAAILWEIWIQPGRDEAYRQEILSDIENFKEMIDRARPTNLQNAKDTIDELSTQLAVVSDAYIELRETENEEDKPE